MSKAFFAAGRGRSEGLRAVMSGGASQSSHQASDLAEDHFVTLAYECSEDVLADRVAPEVIGAVAAGEGGGVEVYQVRLRASRTVIAAVADSFAVQPEAALQTRAVHTAGRVEINGGARSSLYCFVHPKIFSNDV
jgi:hypothetical protein